MVFLLGARMHAADATVKTVDKPAPKEIAESIRAVLEPKALQLIQGDKPTFEIWFRNELALKSKPASEKDAVGVLAETSVVGAVVLNEPWRDYKDNEIPKGTYTARFALQPKDGDHLGTSDFDFYLVLIAAEHDKDLNGLNTFKPMVKASGRSTSSGHPVVISLRPALAGGTLPRVTEPLDEHKAICVKVPGKTSGGDKAEVVFDLVYSGHGHIQ